MYFMYRHVFCTVSKHVYVTHKHKLIVCTHTSDSASFRAYYNIHKADFGGIPLLI